MGAAAPKHLYYKKYVEGSYIRIDGSIYTANVTLDTAAVNILGARLVILQQMCHALTIFLTI